MKHLQHPRGTTAQNDGYTGLAGQLTVDTERNELRLHDAEEPGGHRILNLEQLLLLFMSLDSEFGDTEFVPADRGFLVRIGDREYTMRGMDEGNGITITEPLGTGSNPSFAIDEAWLTNWFGNKAGGKIIYGGTTAGTAAALTLDLPGDATWPDDDGAVCLFYFHTTPNEGATLSIDGQLALPLLTANGSDKVNHVAAANTRALLMRSDSKYYLVGLQDPQEIGIKAITNLAATNVQDALEEIQASIDALEGAGDQTGDTFFTFANLVLQGAGEFDVPLVAGERRMICLQSDEVSDGVNPPSPISHVINGVTVNAITQTGGSASGQHHLQTLGILSREVDTIYFTPVMLIAHVATTVGYNASAASLMWSAASQYQLHIKRHCGTVLTAATTCELQNGSVLDSAEIFWSDNGVAVA